MIVNVNDLKGMIRAYAVSIMKEKFSNLDMTENSAYDDLFVKPMVELLEPIFVQVNGMELKMNLDNAEYIDPEELDEHIRGNYGIFRNGGEKATTTISLGFEEINTKDDITIPAGIIFATRDGLRFQTTESKTYYGEEVELLYNENTGLYELETFVEATDVGSVFNVDAGSINVCETLFHTNLMTVSNVADVDNGIDKESNVDYAQRAKDFYITRHLGIKEGYEAFILENFIEIEDIKVVGYKDKYMTRDLLNIVGSDGEVYAKHAGGMVDIYIKGCKFDHVELDVVVKGNYMVLSQPSNLIDIASISVVNDTDTTKTPVVKSSEKVMIGTEEKVVVVLENGLGESFSTEIDNDIYISYTTTAGLGTQSHIDSFVISQPLFRLESPAVEITQLIDLETLEPLSNISSLYEIVRGGEKNTSREESYIKLLNADSVPNGSRIGVNYSVNATLRDIAQSLDEEGNRIITTDVLVKEAEAKPLNLHLKVATRAGYELDDFRISQVKNSLYKMNDTFGIGQGTEESDITAWLYMDEDVSEFLDYIELPLTAFYVADDTSSPLTPTNSGKVIVIEGIERLIVNKVSVEKAGV